MILNVFQDLLLATKQTSMEVEGADNAEKNIRTYSYLQIKNMQLKKHIMK